MMSSVHCLVYVLFTLCCVGGNDQIGPEPWQYQSSAPVLPDPDQVEGPIPPDLRPVNAIKTTKSNGGNSYSEWFFKRLLVIFLKGGQTKNNGEDVEVSLQMKFKQNEWNTINEYISSQNGLTEDMYRRSLGYVEEAIYKPSVTERISLAWSEYIQIYLSMYKSEIMYGLIIVSILAAPVVLWNKTSHKHFRIIIFIIVYTYEVFVSYKEAEKAEYDKFISALNQCQWYFWSSSCELPGPDMLLFLKHMHPLKICVRLFTILMCEPMLAISSTVQQIVNGITDGLWFPLDKIIGASLIVSINILLIMFLTMIIFNFVLNIPFNLSFFAGLVNFGVRQRHRNITGGNAATSNDTGDRISGTNLNRLLNIIENHKPSNNVNKSITFVGSRNSNALKRSSSLGRLTDSLKSISY